MKILYISTSFSTITHTFITREISVLRERGNQIGLLSLRLPPKEKVASSSECDLSGERVVYPVSFLSAIGHSLHWTIKNPRGMFKAILASQSDPNDGFITKLKLLYQIMVTTTVADWVVENSFMHIHSHFASPPTTIAMFLHFLTGIPFSFTGHAADIYREPAALAPKLRFADGVVAISKFNLNHYHSIVPNLNSYRIIHCGISPAKFRFEPRKEVKSPVRIFSVGRLVTKKGFEYLVGALKELNEKEIPWVAEVAGNGP